MKQIKVGSFIIFIIISFGFLFLQSNEVTPKIVLPSEMKWIDSSDPNYKISTALLSGDPKLKGMYATQVKISKGTKLMPHSHPDDRMVVVLSGNFLYAYGNVYDESKMRELSAGTFLTEPANKPHFAFAKSDILLQVTGYGPSGTKYVDEKQK